MGPAQRIDVHHHFVPPKYKEVVSKKRPMQPCMEAWTVQGSVEDMDKADVAKSLEIGRAHV